MIEVKQAVANAVRFLRELYGEEALEDVRLEEVEVSEDENVWCITLGFCFPDGGSASSDLAAALSLPPEREYKIVTVSASTGDVRSMKIRRFP
jgi:hypothetical protein